MKKAFGPILSIIGLLLAAFILSKVVPAVGTFFAWFFITKEEMEAPLTTGEIVIIDIITHLVTYSLVGVIFGFSGKWDKQNMHYVYVIISGVISLGLAVLLRFIIDYYWILLIILGICLVAVGIILIKIRKNSKAEKDQAAE